MITELDFNSMISSIALGLFEKEQSNDKYPYSSHLTFGIDVFVALALQCEEYEVVSSMHEAKFILDYATKPIRKWFDGWKSELVSHLSSYSLYNTGALITLLGSQNYKITDACADLIETTEEDFSNALTQSYIYQMMQKLEQGQYVSIRSFLVLNPICSEIRIRQFKFSQPHEIWEILNLSYEDIPDNSYRCPKCGWTMTFYGNQAYCCNQTCISPLIDPSNLEKLDRIENKRLRQGLMRYMCIPGKLELDIKEYVEKCGYKADLWPEQDRYDIKIYFSDKTWAIDAKTHRSPYTLAIVLKTDSIFKNLEATKKFYVIPHERLKEYPDYCQICNSALIGTQIECITDKQLYHMIREEKKNECF